MESSEMNSMKLTEKLKAAEDELEMQNFRYNEDLTAKDEIIAQLRLELMNQRAQFDEELQERTQGIQAELEDANHKLEVSRNRIWSMLKQIENEKTEKSSYMLKLVDAKEQVNLVKASRSIIRLQLKNEQDDHQKAQEMLKRKLSEIEVLKKEVVNEVKPLADNPEFITDPDDCPFLANRPRKPDHLLHRIERQYNENLREKIAQEKKLEKMEQEALDRKKWLANNPQPAAKVTPKHRMTKEELFFERSASRVEYGFPQEEKKSNLPSYIAALLCIKGNK